MRTSHYAPPRMEWEYSGPRFCLPFRRRMEAMGGTPGKAARCSNWVPDAIPRVSYAMRQPNFRRRLQIVAQTADPARTVRASCIARSTLLFTEDQLSSGIRTGLSADRSIESRSVCRVDVCCV